MTNFDQPLTNQTNNHKQDNMNPEQPLDIKTLLHLMTIDGMPHGHILRLISQQCNIPEERFIAAITATAMPPMEQSRKYLKWTPELTQDLLERWNNGDKPGHIAKSLGCSTQTVYQRVAMLRKHRTDVMFRSRKG